MYRRAVFRIQEKHILQAVDALFARIHYGTHQQPVERFAVIQPKQAQQQFAGALGFSILSRLHGLLQNLLLRLHPFRHGA